MLEYLNFFLLCTLFALIFYLYFRTKKYFTLLKMAEDNLIFSGYDPPQSALGISNQDALSEDLESDPFLNSALQRFTCKLYYRFGSFLAPLSVGLITGRHYLSECNKNGGTSATNGTSGMEDINLE